MYDIPDAENYQVPHGHRAIDVIRRLRPDIDAQKGLRVIEDMEIEDTADLTVLPGVEKLLAGLPPERWAIVTSATRRLLLGRLAVAGLPIPERIVSGDMVERGKPHPEPYMRGAEMLGLAPGECVVVEDAPSGVGAGIEAGCRVLAILGTHTADELRQATWIARSLEQVRVVTGASSLTLRFHPVS